MDNTSIIISGENSNIIKSKNNSNIHLFKNINISKGNIIQELSDENIIEELLRPGDIATCPDGTTRTVGRDGRFYCDIDPNGNGLYPRTTVKCSNGTRTSVNDRGNIIGGCTPANGSEVTCYADFETPVINGTWSCAQGEDGDTIRFNIDPFFLNNGFSIFIFDASTPDFEQNIQPNSDYPLSSSPVEVRVALYNEFIPFGIRIESSTGEIVVEREIRTKDPVTNNVLYYFSSINSYNAEIYNIMYFPV